jgi:phosphoribosylformylglycinamidine cyclo-ligase
VLKVGDDVAIAICTDGVGSKTLVASALDKYDTIGNDCVAMNVNDLICVGARPIALVDYLAVHSLDARRADSILEGLGRAATEAGIAIPGGETAQLPEVIGAPADESAFDLAGACIGTVHPERLVLGHEIRPGDALIGVASSGIHSNGLTLARRVLLRDRGHALHERVAPLTRTIGEELLEPTEIYVRPVLALRSKGIETTGLAHITGDGLANLCRLEADVEYVVDRLPEPPAIFSLIQRAGAISDAEMFRVFNMGVGFVVVVRDAHAADVVRALNAGGYRADRIGTVVPGERRVVVEPRGLVGRLRDGEATFTPV